MQENFQKSIAVSIKNTLRQKFANIDHAMLKSKSKTIQYCLEMIENVIQSDFHSSTMAQDVENALNIFLEKRDFELSDQQIESLLFISCRNILLEIQKECAIKNIYLIALQNSNTGDVVNGKDQIATTIGFLTLFTKKAEAMLVTLKAKSEDKWLIKDLDHHLNTFAMVENLEAEYPI